MDDPSPVRLALGHGPLCLVTSHQSVEGSGDVSMESHC